ncbi:MAG: hypothetical protein H6686_05475 [Fibrobacteria bacterium]|nr:hypothetical protein [Fibrobacteria bacterium]
MNTRILSTLLLLASTSGFAQSGPIALKELGIKYADWGNSTAPSLDFTMSVYDEGKQTLIGNFAGLDGNLGFGWWDSNIFLYADVATPWTLFVSERLVAGLGLSFGYDVFVAMDSGKVLSNSNSDGETAFDMKVGLGSLIGIKILPRQTVVSASWSPVSFGYSDRFDVRVSQPLTRSLGLAGNIRIGTPSDGSDGLLSVSDPQKASSFLWGASINWVIDSN